jgi:phage-related holin
MSRTTGILDAFQYHLARHFDDAKPGLVMASGAAGTQLVAFQTWIFTPTLPAAVVVLLLVDLATGVTKAIVHPDHKVNSDTGFRGLIKLLLNLLALSLVIYLYQALPGWISGLVQWLLLIPIVTELTSVFENLSDIEDALGVKTGWIKGVLKLIRALKTKAYEQAEQAMTGPLQTTDEGGRHGD